MDYISMVKDTMNIDVTQEQVNEYMPEAVCKRDWIISRNRENKAAYMDSRYLALLLGEIIVVNTHFGIKKESAQLV